MRDREFAVAKKALAEGTQNKTTIPESFSLIGDGVLHGKKGKQHTVIAGVPVPTPQLDYGRIELRGDGKLLEPPREFEPDSLLRNFYNWMSSQHGAKDASDGSWGDGLLNVKDTAGNVRSGARPIGQGIQNMEAGTHGYIAAYNTGTFGVQIGSGNTAVDWENDCSIETQIANGQAAGEMQYATSQLPAPDLYDSGNQILDHTRYYDNFNAGLGSITINEIALISYMYAGGVLYNVAIARDVLGTPLVVPFRAQAAVTYGFTLPITKTDSRLRNFFNHIISQALSVNGADAGTFDDGYVNVKDTSNNIRSGAVSICNTPSNTMASFGYSATAGTVTHGILIGTNSTLATFNDYNIGTLIPHATMNYSVSEAPTRVWADPVMTLTQARTFTNVSGGSVNVVESCPVCRLYVTSSYATAMTHDVFSPIAVANGESLRIQYQFRVTYPA